MSLHFQSEEEDLSAKNSKRLFDIPRKVLGVVFFKEEFFYLEVLAVHGSARLCPRARAGYEQRDPRGSSIHTLRAHRQSCALPWEHSELSPHSPCPEEVLSQNDFLDLLVLHRAFLPSNSTHGQESRGY